MKPEIGWLDARGRAASYRDWETRRGDGGGVRRAWVLLDQELTAEPLPHPAREDEGFCVVGVGGTSGISGPRPLLTSALHTQAPTLLDIGLDLKTGPPTNSLS